MMIRSPSLPGQSISPTVDDPSVSSGCGVQGAGCRVQIAGCRVQGAGFRVQGAGCRVQGAGCRASAPTSTTPPSALLTPFTESESNSESE